jgi:catechol 2,3-dioxygenase-like lactoylglutathione lyase family enzyme
MPHVLGIDHVAFAAADQEATWRLLRPAVRCPTHLDYAPDGKSLVRQIAMGGALLSIHQTGNGLELVARHPTVGGADLCLRWPGSIESAADLLREHGLPIIDGPSCWRCRIFFRDPDGNLQELMAADGTAAE